MVVMISSLSWALADSPTSIERWQITFGTEDAFGWSVQQTSDGGYIISGFREEDNERYIYLAKANSSGNLEWERTIKGAYSEGGPDIVVHIQLKRPATEDIS